LALFTHHFQVHIQDTEVANMESNTVNQHFTKKHTFIASHVKKYFVTMLFTEPWHSWQHRLPHKFQSHINRSKPSKIHGTPANAHNMHGHRYEIQLRSHQKWVWLKFPVPL